MSTVFQYKSRGNRNIVGDHCVFFCLSVYLRGDSLPRLQVPIVREIQETCVVRGASFRRYITKVFSLLVVNYGWWLWNKVMKYCGIFSSTRCWLFALSALGRTRCCNVGVSEGISCQLVMDGFGSLVCSYSLIVLILECSRKKHSIYCPNQP